MATTTIIPTNIDDLPDVILTQIISLIPDTRTRNSASLVTRKWLSLERLTRQHLTLRGNLHDLVFSLPACFRHVTSLDISHISPWGVSLSNSASDSLLPLRLKHAFPQVTSLTLYSRSHHTITLLSGFLRGVSTIKLVRWHQRPQGEIGADFFALFAGDPIIKSLDLSSFYFWAEDLPPALDEHVKVGRELVCLNLLNPSLAEGFKSEELIKIVSSCPNLVDFRVGCMFDPRYFGYVGDDAVVEVSSMCKKLKVLHLVEVSSNSGFEDVDEEGFVSEDAGFSVNGLVSFFSGLRVIEELVMEVGKNVRDSWVCLEALASKCPNLRTLGLGHFHGVCKAIESHLDGVALCSWLESLSIKNSADLSDMRLIEIGRGCDKLAKFEVHGCKKITMRGLRTMVCMLSKTLVEVGIYGCKYLDAPASVRAVDPISERIRKLHIDCIWDGEKPVYEDDLALVGLDCNGIGDGFDDYDDDDNDIGVSNFNHFEDDEMGRLKKRLRVSSDVINWYATMNGNGCMVNRWERLEFLSLWIGVGELLTPLVDVVGLEECPNLSEIHIKVEGDCRERPRPSQLTFGLSSLVRYPKLSKMKLDCGETIGYALTAPSGHMDLSLWERFFLNGIRNLSLNELDYWPPQDREVNHRSLSLPAAGLLQQCAKLRKLFIHGTTHEHFMMFLLHIPNLRDVQLRGDYYPAPENDMSSEMRVDSCCRFEYKLNARLIPD